MNLAELFFEGLFIGIYRRFSIKSITCWQSGVLEMMQIIDLAQRLAKRLKTQNIGQELKWQGVSIRIQQETLNCKGNIFAKWMEQSLTKRPEQTIF